MDSILEVQRHLHEERERCIEAIVQEKLHEPSGHKGKVNREHRIKGYLNRYDAATNKLVEIYKDDDKQRSFEVDAVSGPNEFAEFYSRIKSLKDVHKREPDQPAALLHLDFMQYYADIEDPTKTETDVVEFTDEEGYGRFLDLHTLFAQYLNLKDIKRIDYNTYLSVFDRLADASRETTKKTGAWRAYVIALHSYLASFLRRTQPLLNLEEEEAKAESDFETKWPQGQVPGWPATAAGGSSVPGASSVAPLDLAPFNSAVELEALGLDRLKGALQSLGLKCGGTLKERAERLFATKGHKLSDLEKAALSKRSDVVEKERAKEKALALLEHKTRLFCDLLSAVRTATKENVERKQARGGVESDDDEPIQEVEVEEIEEIDSDVPYNPKNLPLGWDGKPIPYWLWKLHGLNISYSCEICGNQVYKGPKAFQRHFSEWRHSHGMRCLGIPNTTHFANITSIKDALDLWQKICIEKEKQRWNPDLDEEYEDSHGNVVSRRTFEDLKRQGLL